MELWKKLIIVVGIFIVVVAAAVAFKGNWVSVANEALSTIQDNMEIADADQFQLPEKLQT